jgi:outer membrane protein assembly factor BamB
MLRTSILLLALLVTSALFAEDWRQFRGNANTGVANDDKVPTQWSETENMAWKIDLPGHGLSSPIVVGDRIFLTASDGFNQDHLLVLALDVKTGKKLWERDFLATGSTMRFPTSPVATCTPCSDGERIFAQYSTNDVVCLDLDGNYLWSRGLTLDYPSTGNSLGMASSPVVSGNTLVVQVESDSEGVAVALDVKTGLNRWKLERPDMANWTSPIVLPGSTAESELVVLQSGKGLSAVHPYTGLEAWNFDKGASTIPSSVVAGGLVITPSNGLAALQPEPGQKSPKVVWQSERLGPGTSSPTVYGDNVYVIGKAGVLSGANVKTGDALPQVRLPGKESISSTPVAANGHLYILRENGLAIVVKAGDEPEKVFEYDFAERFQSTPAIANGALYVRSDKHLWKIASQ